MEKYISSVTNVIGNGREDRWSLLNWHLGWGQISLIELDDLEDAVRDLCFDCFLKDSFERFSWDDNLLKQGFRLKDHKIIKEIHEGLKNAGTDWQNLFLSFVLDGNEYRIGVVVGCTSDSWHQDIEELKQLSYSPSQVLGLVEWFEDFRGEYIESEDFWDLVINGYRSTDDLKLLEHDMNKASYGLTVPPLESLRRIDGGIKRFFIMNSKIERVLPWFGDLELDVRIEEIVKTLNLGITEECFDSIDVLIRTELGDNAYLVYDEDEEKGGFVPFLDTLGALREVGLPITDLNVSRYFCMSSVSILFAIDNEISDEKYFACARLFKEVSDIQNAVSILEICQDLDETYALVKARATAEIVISAEGRGVSVAALTELVKKEPQFPCAALLSWLDAGFEADSLDEMLEWWRAGFTPDNVASWREFGFNALESIAWLRHTSDPVVASRRKEAGISPTQ